MKVGDKVRVLDEAASGYIARIEGESIFVRVDDFEFKYAEHQLLIEDINEDFLTQKYRQFSPPHESLKAEDRSKPKELTKAERIEELGRVSGRRNSKNILEFDLHIHDLLVKHDHMSPGEMLNYQLDYAVHCLEETIKKRERALIFIHGVGKGVLRVELHKIIKAYGFSFHDGFMQEYGVGATRVEMG